MEHNNIVNKNKRNIGFTFFSIIMGLNVFLELGSLEWLFKYESQIKTLLAINLLINAIISGIASIGFWREKKWVVKVMIYWLITTFPIAVFLVLIIGLNNLNYSILSVLIGAVFINTAIALSIIRYSINVLNQK